MTEQQLEYFRKYRERRKTHPRDSRTFNKRVLFTVWNNKTDELIILDGTTSECAKAMGIAEKTFASIVCRSKQGKLKKWSFEKILIREMNDDENN